MLSHTQAALAPHAAPLKIRRARVTDLPVLVELLCQLFSIETDFAVRPDRHARGLRLLLGSVRRGRAYVAVAETQGEVIGMATLQTVVSTAEGARSGWIEDVVIREDRRGAGIGRLLIADITRWAQAKGVARLQLLADRRNRPALAFYGRLAFQPTNMICLRAGHPQTPRPTGSEKNSEKRRTRGEAP